MKLTKFPYDLTACLLALCAGAAATLAFSPFDYWIIAYGSLFVLVLVATYPKRKLALWATFCWAIGYFGVGVNWLHVSMSQFGGVPLSLSYVAVLLLASYLALYPLLFTYLIQRFNVRNPWLIAAIFSMVEYLRGEVLTGFPWLQIGYSQIDSPFAGIAPLFGVAGLTFFVVLISSYLVRLVRLQKTSLWVNVSCVFVLLIAGFSSHFLNFIQKDTSKKALKMSLVQGNIPQNLKWDPIYLEQTLQRYQGLMLPHLGKSDVIILPESAIPAIEYQVAPLFEQWQTVAQRSGTEFIIGTLYQQHQQLFNSAMVVGNPDKPYGTENPEIRYKKFHLVPFGEYLPMRGILGSVLDMFNLPNDLSQGNYLQPPLIAKNHRFNTAICYEILFGDQIQDNLAHYDADYLLTISNDAWFGASIGPWQHFQIARMRALEFGKPLVRVANTGITAFVDHLGKVIAQAPQFETTVLSAEIQVTKGKTPFSQYGNLPFYLFCVSLLALSAIYFFYQTKKPLGISK